MSLLKFAMPAGLGVALLGLFVGAAFAQNAGRPYTAGEGDAAEITACNADAVKFCNDEVMWQHEMEECLLQHIGQVSKACKAQLQPFSFKKYYNTEPHLF